MYEIYLDSIASENLVWAPGLDWCKVSDPTLTRGLNAAGTLEFSMPPDHELYNDLKKMSSTIIVVENNTPIWTGRVLHDNTTFYRMREVYCEGALSFLLDTLVEPYDYTDSGVSVSDYFTALINHHNEQVAPANGDTTVNRQFQLGTCNVTGTISSSQTAYRSTLDEIQSSLLDVFGGYIKITYYIGSTTPIISYLSDYSETSSQVIELGINLMDLEEYIDATDICTVLIATGAKDLSYTYTYAEGVSLYGKIYKTASFPDIETQQDLITAAQAYFTDGAGKLVKSFNIRAIDLHDVDEFQEPLDVGSMVEVYSRPHGLFSGLTYMCSESTVALDDLSQSSYTFGDSKKGLTYAQAVSEKNIQNLSNQLNTDVTNISNSIVDTGSFYFPSSKLMVAADASYTGHVVSGTTEQERNAIVYTIFCEMGADAGGSMLVAQELRDVYTYWDNSKSGDSWAMTWQNLICSNHYNPTYWYTGVGIDPTAEVYSKAYAAYQKVFEQGQSAIQHKLFAHATKDIDFTNGGSRYWWYRVMAYTASAGRPAYFWGTTLFD